MNFSYIYNFYIMLYLARVFSPNIYISVHADVQVPHSLNVFFYIFNKNEEHNTIYKTTIIIIYFSIVKSLKQTFFLDMFQNIYTVLALSHALG